MTKHGKLSSVVVAGFAIAAAAVFPTTALAQQTDSVAVSSSDTAQSGGIRVIRSGADTSAGEAAEPGDGGMVLPRSALQQLMGQMFGGGSRRGGARATPRVSQSADSAGAIKKSSDSTAADATKD